MFLIGKMLLPVKLFKPQFQLTNVMSTITVSSGLSKIFCLLIILIDSLKSISPMDETSIRNHWTSSSKSGPRRSERYLVYPTPSAGAATKVQLIMGLGLPMEVDVSMIVGYVMKFNYVLPYNASYLTQPYVPRETRSMNKNVFPGPEVGQEDPDKTLEGIPEEGNWKMSPTRWQIYRLIESTLESFQVSGKGCLLKTVCHMADVSFDNPLAGLFGELVHVLLTPSTTEEKYESSGDREYHLAEAAGRDNPGKCGNLFPECHHDLLEYFTETYSIESAARWLPGGGALAAESARPKVYLLHRTVFSTFER